MLQDDFSGRGWRLQTYIDLLRAVHEANRDAAPEDRLQVVAVNDPVYWSSMQTREDLRLWRKSLTGNDYGMYANILDALDRFESGLKGVFLTNTRHAYKGIRRQDGQFFWNAGTFFAQWHPGWTASVRFHHLVLNIRREIVQVDEDAASTEGRERFEHSFDRVGGGIWDEAFRANGNRPVAFGLAGTPFGREPYAGNHMHRAAPGQTMLDANDAVIFLAPVESLHTSALVDWIYTDAFKQELARRYPILYTENQLAGMMKDAGVSTLEELIEKRAEASPLRLIEQTQGLPDVGVWRDSY
jgi:hypothetical protein